MDETLTRSFNLWIPLVDVNEQNGAVYVLEGSHHAFQAYRGPGINSTLKDVEERIWKKMHALNMKAGEALLYDHALVHGSPPNQTAKVRTGIVLGILPETAEMKLYTTGTRGIEVYECNEDFFLSHQPSDAHKKLRHLQTIDTHQTNVPEEYFASHYPEAEVAPTEQKKPNLFRKLLSKLVS